ncbi:hypothetical protein [Ancylomarina longa]|uniref:Lipoprotein n=1 Tax=Ancylomarina longa TaxID=2487017 RepID=A0A434AW79_9BACT|nr:hypothetical protein [Ancylomarina longa]RUT78742.1 hypothetical protein DLK05_06275 [Ancylomarina longa]
MFKLKSILIISLLFVVISCDTSNEESLNSTDTIVFHTNDIAIDSKIASSLGYEELVIKEGSYQVDRCDENFGTVVFDLQQSIKSEKVMLKTQAGFGIRIRIGTRKSNCSRGIGFRCGLISAQSSQIYDQERDKLVKIDIDEESKTASLEFLEPVDWEKLKEE